jgi:hypothetical protein
VSGRALPDGAVGSEHLGVRVFCITAPDAQQLADRLALILGEHMAADDQLHITYGVVQSGWEHELGRSGLRPRDAHTQLFFEHTALLVLRPAAACND